MSLYQWASDLGHAQAAVALGAIYYNGIHGNHDYAKAFEWAHSKTTYHGTHEMPLSRYYQTGAERGSIDGWRNVAAMHLTGEGIPKNEQLAKQIMNMIKQLPSSDN